MAEDTDNRQLVRVNVIADFSGLTVRMIWQLRQEGVIEVTNVKDTGVKGNPAGLFDFLPTIRALLLYYRELSHRRHAGDNPELNSEKLKTMSAKRELDELKLLRAKGDVHTSQDISALFGPMLTRLRVGLLSLPMGLAPLVALETDMNKIAELIDDRIRRALDELTQFDFKDYVKNNKDKFIAEIDDGRAETDEETN